MTTKECYEQIGADYDEVLKRLGNEDFLKRVALKFIQDSNFNDLKSALKSKDIETAFRAVHTLKGICINLGFDDLQKVSSNLTESLRSLEFKEDCNELFEKVEKEYKKVIDALKKIDD